MTVSKAHDYFDQKISCDGKIDYGINRIMKLLLIIRNHAYLLMAMNFGKRSLSSLLLMIGHKQLRFPFRTSISYRSREKVHSNGMNKLLYTSSGEP
jgi:hypothetical protein